MTAAAAVVEKMCSSKRMYTDELAAIHACIGSSVAFAKPFRHYKCPHCGKWHVTSRIEKEDAA